jgi:hypothetical protein
MAENRYPRVGFDVCDFADCDAAPSIFSDDDNQHRYCREHEADGVAADNRCYGRTLRYVRIERR